MLNEVLNAVLAHEGVVSIVTWGREEPHVVCTWNSYICTTDDERLLVPVGEATQVGGLKHIGQC